MRSLVFVTTELYPYTAGGIGRVLFNMLRTMGDADRARTVVVILDRLVDAVTFHACFPGVELVQVSSRDSPRDRHSAGRRHPPQWAYTNTPWHWSSAVVLRALQRLAKERSIEYVEFPDWGGLGFCTIQEKLLTGFLRDTTVAVRLHSTHTALLKAEARAVGLGDLNLADMERKCLRDCDRVVTQLASLSHFMRDIYGFPSQEWDDRVVCHAPPVLLDGHDHASQTAAPYFSGTVLFTSKIQRIKRPDLFIRGVAGFMRQCAAFKGKAGLSAHSTDADYDRQIVKLIPSDLASRFEFLPNLTMQEREQRIAAATVVIPSSFESFCLAAYEASLLGARLILNGSNPAFDENSPWQDGINCIKFDGTVSSLTAALLRSFQVDTRLVPVVLPKNPWPWLHPTTKRVAAEPSATTPLVSVIVPHYNLGDHLPETLENIVAFDYENLEIVVVDDASTDTASRQLIELLGNSQTAGLKVLRLPGNVGLSAARNAGIREASGKYVLTLDADDLLDTSFLGKAVRALEDRSEFDVVITPAAYFVDGHPSPLQAPAVDAGDYAVFTGEAKLTGLLQNRYSTATAIFRKSLLERFPYNEDLHCYEDWSLYMRLVDANIRFIVSTDACFFYRKRADSMVHAPKSNLTLRIDYADLMRTSAPGGLRYGMGHLIAGIDTPAAPAAPVHAGGANDVHLPVADELRNRILHIEQLAGHVFQATSPLLTLFRIPRGLWQRMLPFRHWVARRRGRIA